MAKSNSQQQGLFSFFDDVEKTEPAPKPKRSPLRPPENIEAVEPEVEEMEEKAEVEAKIEVEDKIEIEAEVENENEVAPTLAADLIEEKEQESEITEPTQTIEPAQFEAESEVQPEIAEDETPVAEETVVKKPSGTRGRRSVKEHTAAAELVEIPDDEELFKKQYYSMGEVTAMFNENHSLIRYWESEFDILKPKKNGKGDRFFRPVDVKNLYLIYDLLRRRKFTIDGAREYLKNDKKAGERFAAVQSLQKIKSFFLELKATL